MPERPFGLSVLIFPAKPEGAAALQTLARGLVRDTPTVGVELNEAGIDLFGDTENDMDRFIVHLRKAAPFEFTVGALRVQYRETVAHQIVTEYVHKLAKGAHGEFASVKIEFSPGEPKTGFVFTNSGGEHLRPEFAAAIEYAIAQEKELGLINGLPLIDFRANLIEGNYHEVDSSERTFAIAARGAFKQLAVASAVRLLEPWLLMEVRVPEEFLGPVIGDMKRRRGRVLATQTLEDGMERLTAEVPAGTTFGYAHTLGTITGRRFDYSAVFDHYELVPTIITDHDPKEPMAAAVGRPRRPPADAIAAGDGVVVPFPARRSFPKVEV